MGEKRLVSVTIDDFAIFGRRKGRLIMMVPHLSVTHLTPATAGEAARKITIARSRRILVRRGQLISCELSVTGDFGTLELRTVTAQKRVEAGPQGFEEARSRERRKCVRT